jgi:hypothetical protein
MDAPVDDPSHSFRPISLSPVLRQESNGNPRSAIAGVRLRQACITDILVRAPPSDGDITHSLLCLFLERFFCCWGLRRKVICRPAGPRNRRCVPHAKYVICIAFLECPEYKVVCLSKHAALDLLQDVFTVFYMITICGVRSTSRYCGERNHCGCTCEPWAIGVVSHAFQ